MPHSKPSFVAKFKVAWRGWIQACRTQSSLQIHLAVSLLVVILAALLRRPPVEWAILLGMIALVITAELLNTSIEWLVAAWHPDWDPRVGLVLDVAAAAVLWASILAMAVGLILLGPPLWSQLFG